MNESIQAKRPVASAKAKPGIVYLDVCLVRLGTRETPLIKELKILPILILAPVSPMAANPASIVLTAEAMSLK